MQTAQRFCSVEPLGQGSSCLSTPGTSGYPFLFNSFDSYCKHSFFPRLITWPSHTQAIYGGPTMYQTSGVKCPDCHCSVLQNQRPLPSRTPRVGREVVSIAGVSWGVVRTRPEGNGAGWRGGGPGCRKDTAGRVPWRPAALRAPSGSHGQQAPAGRGTLYVSLTP